MKNLNVTKLGVLLVMMVITAQPLFAMLVYEGEMTTSEGAVVSIKGTVTDNADGTALVGASITLKGTPRGTVTDADGKFTFQHVNAGDTLVFTYMGYRPVEYVVPAQADGELVINIKMDFDVEIFGEVAVSEVYKPRQ
jgi:hypothetical protein